MAWFDILKTVRKLHNRGERITSLTLQDEANLDLRVSSAWLSKLLKWGYLRKLGKDGKTNVYEITEWGHRFKPKGKGGKR